MHEEVIPFSISFRVSFMSFLLSILLKLIIAGTHFWFHSVLNDRRSPCFPSISSISCSSCNCRGMHNTFQIMHTSRNVRACIINCTSHIIVGIIHFK